MKPGFMYSVVVTPSGWPSKVLGYLCVSTEEQAQSGAGLEAQRTRIQAEAERRDWRIQWVVDDGYSAGSLQRPGIRRALDMLRRGEADALVASKLDRLSRSVLDFARLLETAQEQGWGLILLDLDLDTTKPTGRLVAHVMSAVAEFERQRIAERTREALTAVKARGVRLGRPPTVERQVVERVCAERAQGLTLQAIADGLNADAAPTGHGGRRWWPSTVRAVLASAAAKAA